MIVKVVQVNIYKGQYLKDLVKFLKVENPDVICMQEVTGGIANLCDNPGDLFIKLKHELGLDGVFNADYHLSDGDGFMGNAVLTRFKIKHKNVVILNEHDIISLEASNSSSFWQNGPRHLLDCTVDLPEEENIHFMSVHSAWTAPPTDTLETIRQANVIASYLKSLERPYILCGDFNAVIQGKTIGIINDVANNLMFNSGVLETTNPKVHKISPRGYLIDYIFASKDIRINRLTVPKITVSDHLPIVAELTV